MSLEDLRKRFLAGALAKPDYIKAMHAEHARLFEYARWLPSTDIARIEISDLEVVMTSREAGVRIVVDPQDMRIAPVEVLNFMHYEKPDLDMITRLVPDRAGILDIGANVGWYSLTLAKKKPGARIMAFEPIPKTFRYLERNLRENGVANVTAFPHGFSDREGELTFFYYPGGSGNASSARLAEAEALTEVKARVTTVDAFMAGRDFPVDFIKCDVEGAELFVFKGALATLRSCRPLVFSELLRKWSAKFGYHPNELIGLFAAEGYRCFAAAGGKLVERPTMTDETVETNFYFLHREAHAGLIREHANV